MKCTAESAEGETPGHAGNTIEKPESLTFVLTNPFECKPFSRFTFFT